MKNNFFKILSVLLVSLIILGVLSSCNVVNNPIIDDDYDIENSTDFKDGVIANKKNPISDFFGDMADRAYSKEEAYVTGEVLTPSVEGSYGEYISNNGIHAGTLTAGELKDNLAYNEWLSLFESDEWKTYQKNRELFSTDRIAVTVLGKDGQSAIFNQKVELIAKDGSVLYTQKTDISGKAYLFYPESKSSELAFVKVGETKSEYVSGKEYTFTLDQDSNEIKKLDLMLMVDTTGSMGDELNYLKVELSDMVERIAKANEALSIRVSVNFYRDDGDEYTVKYFDFRFDIDECIKQISEQSANGGGDYPEAVHTALENVVSGHQWRNEAVKICFFVLDAPPHEESEIQGINSNIIKSVKTASDLGIRIIPVASSGVDKETEFILRSFALMTGGTYIFLTDDSGIGYSHLSPSTESYDVEKLNECMIRVVCEYCGLEYEPKEKVPTDSLVYGEYVNGNYSIILNANGTCDLISKSNEVSILSGNFRYEDSCVIIETGLTKDSDLYKPIIETYKYVFLYSNRDLVYMKNVLNATNDIFESLEDQSIFTLVK